MEEWRFEPAHDFGLSAEQRRLSLRREVGLESAISCFLWRSITRVYLAIAHRLKIRGPRKFTSARAVYSGGESCESSRCHHPRRNSAVAICRRRLSDCRRRHIFYQTGVVDFRDRIYERVADLAKKLRRAFAGRFAGAIAAKGVHLHSVSGRNAHSHGRDGAIQARAWATDRGDEHPDRALLPERNICGFAGNGNGAALEKNFGACGEAIVVCRDNERSGWLGIDCSSDRKCGAKFNDLGSPKLVRQCAVVRFWAAHAPRVLAMAPWPSRTFSAKSIAARRRNEHARAACASRKDQSAAARTELRRQFDRVFVAEDFHGLLELLGFEGLLQDRDRTFSQDAIEHFAVGITGDDDDRTIGLLPFHEIVNGRRPGHRAISNRGRRDRTAVSRVRRSLP